MKIKAILLFLVATHNVSAQFIDNSLGVDPRVNYQKLTELGPWDDRNYDLTLEDLAWLSDNEHELKEMVPAFYRVQFRKEFPDTPRIGKVQYPRSLLNYYVLKYDGYLIDGLIYRAGKWLNDYHSFEVTMENGLTPGEIFREQIKQNTRTLSGEVLVFSGAESAVSVSPADPELVVAGLNRNGQEMLYSSDGGDTWTSAPDLTGSECCDPAMDWKSDGSYVYNVTLGGNQVWFYRSDDNGQTWDSLADITPGDNRRELSGPTGSLNDKEYIHVDQSPTSPFQDNIYITWHQSNIMQFAVSDDDGNTFTTTSFTAEDRGIGSDIVTGRDGTIYHFWPAFNNPDIQMNKSTNGGTAFSPAVVVAPTNDGFDFPIPSMDSRFVFIYVAADIDLTGGPYDGRLYASWTDTLGPQSTAVNNHARIQVGYSDDGGDTWNVTTPHETDDALEVDRWHQWLKVDRNGIVHVIFYDTRNFADRSGVDVYHSYSVTGGENWSAPTRLTSVSSPEGSGFQFGDYNGMDFGDSDDGVAIFSDNRAEGGGSPDMDVYVAPVLGPIDLIFENGFEAIN
ncbi:hypothetical protein [Marinicella litoralis]|uniref:BNR repeat protein n=1 Tax=Marinicella litoralis TaxID=644220 RepID=A0A4R6XP91_9GAMM|nr:hypothetical protein [Marinicella litoralis]TDR19567.1 hypothetical protein C8D91_2124 [Marinicella litoralis]